MLFNSFEFAVFLPIVFILYWIFDNRNLKIQNLIILISSYVFYGWWDWKFLSLILFSTIVDFSVGNKIYREKNQSKRKTYLLISIVVNLGLLGIFKYYNFFIESFTGIFSLFGNEINVDPLRIILPVGISFYTFQTMSYTIDIFRKKLKPTNDFFAFAAFVSFFPQLVAGPIERATNLLPQFFRKREFNYPDAVDGMRQILWGLFKKIVIADRCAIYANLIFNNSSDYSGSTLFLGAIFFAFQIYGDFSGYSDIAIGVARLFGFRLMKNFSFPYFSRDIAEFWRRWHISLSTWFRDYLYIPLGGSKRGISISIRNTFLVFVISGLWHGANWTFVLWGVLNAAYYLPLLVLNKNRINIKIVASERSLPSIKEVVSISMTFFLVVLSWIFFRAESVTQAVNIISEIFSKSLFKYPEVFPKLSILMLILFVMIEWFGRKGEYGVSFVRSIRFRPYRWSIYLAFCLFIFLFQGNKQDFIYFQF